MKTNKHNLLAVLLTMVALIAGQTAQATVTQSMAFEGFFNSNTSMHYWRIHGFWGTVAGPTTGSSGTSQTFNNNTFTFNGGHRITINGTLNFAVANNFTDVTTGSQVTLVFESSNYWFYGATVKTLSDANVTGCSYTISNNNHTITVTIPSGKTFGNVYLDFVPNAPMTNDNTTVTVPAGDYWVSNSSHKPKPEPTVVYGQTTLVKDTDYTLSWSNNSSAGTGTVTVTGKGNYAGSVSANFNIRWARYYVRFDKNHNDATGTMSDQQFTYNTAQNLTANAFSLGSIPFAGWSTTPNGAVTYTDGQSVSNLTAEDGQIVTLYAQWTPPYTFNSTTGVLTLNWGEFNKDNKWGNDVDPSAVTSVTATNEVSFTGDCYNLFYYFTNCTSMDLSKVNTDGLTNIRCMFWGCSSLTTLDLSSWNTAAVTAMTSAFRNCTGLTSLNLTGWNTASVTTMYYLFYGCHNLTTIEGISEWVTESVTNMKDMFYQCRSLTSLDLSGWNTANVTEMLEMFFGCSSLQSLDLSGWNTAKVTSMNSMFKSCSSLQSLDLSGWNTAKVTKMTEMFFGCSSLQSLDLSGWNTANVNRTDSMFEGCTNLATIYVGEGWNTQSVGSYLSDNMFNGCTSLVGGMGTTYDADHIDAEYARIDMGPSSDQPGYFTGSGPVESIVVNPDEIEMNVGATYTIIFTVLPTYATNKVVTFTSSDETVATVNANGVVTGMGGGTTTITIASVSNPEVTTNVSVTVAEIPGDHYQLFTDDDLVEGDYLIVCDGKAMKNKISTNGFQCEEVVDINNVITTENADIVWHIAPSGYSWTIYNAQVAKYAGWSGSSNHVSLLDEINDKAFWSFEDGSDYYIIANYSSGLNYYLCGYGYPDVISFKCAQNTSSPLNEQLSLYKKVGAPVTETYTLEIDGYTNDESGWHLIASPLAGQIEVDDVEQMQENEFDLYRFNQAANAEWENWKADGTDHYHFNLESGRGYLYANSGDVTLTFTGTPYVGNGEVWITNTHYVEFEGWNLVGNPFSVEATIDQEDFYRMNDVGSEIAPATGNTVNPMEGIFVYTAFSGGYVTFTPYSPSTKGSRGCDASLVINLSKGNRGSVIDRAIVRFDSESTLPKLQIFENSPKLYIPQDGEEYAIVSVGSRDAMHCVSTEVPVNFKAKENGEYTITVNPENVNLDYLHLIDNMTGADIDLLTTPSYTFTARNDNYASRFKLVFNALDSDFENDDFAFISNGEININGEGTLQVIDMLGRVIVCRDAMHCVSTAGMTPGVYILRLINGNNVKNQKIIIE